MLGSLFTASQKRVLSLLMGSGRLFSVLDLAKLAGMPYSTTHTILQGLRKTGLIVSGARGERLLYGLNQSDREARTVLGLLKTELCVREEVPDSKKVSVEDVRWNLAGLGAPLLVSEGSRSELAPERTVALALSLARNDPTVARALPLALAASLQGMRYPLLRYLVKETGEMRTLGFFLDLTGALTGRKRLRKAAAEFLDRRVKHSELFFRTVSANKYALELARRRTPPLARKWHFTMNMDMAGFESFFRKFYRDDSKVQPKRH